MIINIKSSWIIVFAGIISGAVLAGLISLPLESWTVSALGMGMAGLIFLKLPRWKLIFIFIFSFFYGMTAMLVSRDQFNHVSWRLPGKIIILEGEMVSFAEMTGKKYKWEFQARRFRMEESRWFSTWARVEVISPAEETPPLIGDRFILKGTIRFPAKEAPGGNWVQTNFFSKGIKAQIRVKKSGDMIFDGIDFRFFILRFFQLIRETAAQQIEKKYNSSQSEILKALLLGMRVSEPVVKQAFSRTGTSHLLSVSGFHTTVIAALIFPCLVFLRLSPVAAVMGACTITSAYVFMTGWGVATQRAGMMAVAVWMAWALGRPQKLLHWLNMACALLLWIDPKRIWDISFQLSFLSMYGILLISPLIKRLIPFPGGDISLAAFLATYPVVLFHFQAFSWTGIFVNLIAVPFFALILPLAMVSLIPWAGYPAMAATQILLSAAFWVIEKTANQSWACFIFPQPSPPLILLYFVLGGIILWLCRLPDAAQS